MIQFTIPYPPTKKGKAAFCRRFGLNAYYAGKHWAQRKKDADELHALTIASMKKARIKWRWYVRSWRKLRRLYEMDSVGPREGYPAAADRESV